MAPEPAPTSARRSHDARAYDLVPAVSSALRDARDSSASAGCAGGGSRASRLVRADRADVLGTARAVASVVCAPFRVAQAASRGARPACRRCIRGITMAASRRQRDAPASEGRRCGYRCLLPPADAPASTCQRCRPSSSTPRARMQCGAGRIAIASDAVALWMGRFGQSSGGLPQRCLARRSFGTRPCRAGLRVARLADSGGVARCQRRTRRGETLVRRFQPIGWTCAPIDVVLARRRTQGWPRARSRLRASGPGAAGPTDRRRDPARRAAHAHRARAARAVRPR